MNQAPKFLEQLPPQFTQFLIQEGIDPKVFNIKCDRRYIRIKPGQDITLEQIKKEFSEDAKQINWNSVMFSLPENLKISSNKLYQDGLIYGIDLSSAAVVQALNLNASDSKILEVCCAPGAKLVYITDTLQQLKGSDDFKVYGVDISKNRLNITKQMVQKYKLNKYINLIEADGTSFNQEKDFDKILVDAECTHEGSIKHLEKYIKKQNNEEEQKANSKKEAKNIKQSKKQLMKNHSNQYTSQYDKANEWSSNDFLSRVLDPVKLNNLTTLQYNLLSNSFGLLKKGGYLVYSTCSFSRKQNEDIISRFIQEHPNQAELIHPFEHIECRDQIPYKEGSLERTIRFEPSQSNSGGMFISKLKKI